MERGRRREWGARFDELTAVLLVGGRGTRLRPLVPNLPKALAPVGGRPFLCCLLDHLAAAGLRRAVLCVGYLASRVREVFGESYGALSLVYSEEPAALGTAGALRHALDAAESDPLLVLNGDSWCDFDPLALLCWHRARGAQGSIWLTRPEPGAGERYGHVATGRDGCVENFREKGAERDGWINAGAYVLSRRMLREIPSDRSVSLESEMFPQWVRHGLYGYRGGGRFLDIGTPESYAKAASFFAGLRERIAPRDERGEPHNPGRRFVILDRDGTVNSERRYLSDPDQIELLPGVAEGLARMRARGLGLIVVTNQSAVGRGYLSERSLAAIHDRLIGCLLAKGVTLDAIYYCPHAPEQNCGCRKPSADLVLRAARELGFDPRQAFFVGDKPCDIELGDRLGGCTILVRSGYGEETLLEASCSPDFAVDDLQEAAGVIEFLLGSDPIAS